MKIVREVFQLLIPHRGLLLWLIVVAILVVGAESFGVGIVFLLLTARNFHAIVSQLPWMGDTIEKILGLPITSRIQLAAGVLVGLTLLRSGLQYAEQLLSLRLQRNVESSLQEQIFRRFHEFSLEHLQRERRGAWMSLLGQYSRKVSGLALQFGQAISNAVVLIAYIGVAFLVSWPVTLVSLAFLLPTGILLRPLIGTRVRAASRATRDLMRETQSTAQERLRAMKIIRLFGQEEWSQQTYRQQLHNYLDQEYKTSALTNLARPLLSLLNVVLLAIVLLLGTYFLPGSPETIVAQLVIFLTIAIRLSGPINTLAQVQTKITEAAPMLHSTLEVLRDDYPLAPRSGTLPVVPLRQAIEFRNVSFAYSPEETLILRNINLSIPHRKITAIVGASGGGKTSLVNLLARLYDPTEGQILVEGIDLRRFDLTAWHRRIAVVSQGVILFHASVWDNLRFARATATDAEIVHAAQQALAHDFIHELPQGYDTLLHEEGLRLSGGQRQRIAIARALLMNADLLVLDEATSELDALTEEAIRQVIHEYAQTRSVLIVAHRLANVVQADYIYVVQDGEIIEAGTHRELISNNELYAQMIQAQQV